MDVFGFVHNGILSLIILPAVASNLAGSPTTVPDLADVPSDAIHPESCL